MVEVGFEAGRSGEGQFGGLRFCQWAAVQFASGKVAVFGILKRRGKVYTVVVDDTKTQTLMPLISKKIKPDSIVYTDSYKSYDVLDASIFHL